MIRAINLAALCMLCICAIATGNTVTVWQGDPLAYYYDRDSVVITGPGTFKISASGGVGLGYIDSITVAFTGDPGPVTIFICAQDDEDQSGATDVWTVNLTGAAPGRVETMRITGILGHADYDYTLVADSAGTISIGSTSESGPTGVIVKPVHILGDLDSLSVTGSILPGATLTVDGKLDSFVGGTDVAGEVSVTGDVGGLALGTLSGEFRIESGHLTGAASIAELFGCFDIVQGNVAPDPSCKFDVGMLAGTLKTDASDLGGHSASWALRRC